MEDRRKILPETSAGHGYTWNGRRLVAVTTVIGTVLRAPELEEWMKRMGSQADRIRDEAGAFGKSVHAGLKAHATGARLLPMEMPVNWRLTAEAGARWLDENLEEIYAVEEPIACLRYGYAGQPDLYGRRIGKTVPCIIDWKTSPTVYWGHRFQTAAYRKAAVETYGDAPAERIVLLLSKDEPGRVTPHVLQNHDADFAGFGYCLGLFGVMQQGGKQLMTTALALETYRADQEVLEAEAEARTVADDARELAVTDEPTNNRALSMLSDCRKTVRRIDELKKRWLDPLNDQIKLIRTDFDAMAAPAKEADQILARKTSDYRMKVAEAARKEQERLRMLAEARQQKAAERAEAKGLEAPPVIPLIPTVAAPAKTVATDNGAQVTFRKQTHFEVTDPALVPREYLKPDEVKIGAVVRAGVFTADNPLPGVRIWTTEEATVRS